MEETVSVFDWNFIYGIGLGLVFGFVVAWLWLKRGKKTEGQNIRDKTYHPKKVKTHKKGELPDSDWPDASWDDVELKADAQINPKHLATVTPSNHESHLG